MGRKIALQEATADVATPSVIRRPRVHAWTASILLHALILTGLWFAHFPQDRERAGEPIIPLATVSHVQKVMQSSVAVPKPRVKLPSEPANTRAATLSRPLLTGGLDQSRPGVSDADVDGSTRIGSQPYVANVPADSPALTGRVSFFGSYSEHRKICYVVDCSGSMKGLFKTVQTRLKQSIADLQTDQYFHVIFFGDGKLKEFAGGKLQRATERNKTAAFDFIDSVHPAGTTNALAALERAMKIRDLDGNAPSVVYFLTDGFDLDGKGSALFSSRIADMAGSFAPATQINTIGFWPQDDDRSVLEAIAARSGGECVLIAGDTDADD